GELEIEPSHYASSLLYPQASLIQVPSLNSKYPKPDPKGLPRSSGMTHNNFVLTPSITKSFFLLLYCKL
ncbi:MAG: hypothetical protein WCO26_18940, partial [Deltaproteobacteria bacterium]